MKRLLFGQYLIEKNVVPAEVVLQALVTQIAETKPLAMIVHEHNWLSAEDQLAVVAYQHQHGVDYRNAASSLGKWSEELEHKAEQEIYRHRRPLGELILEQTDLPFSELTKALDEYVASLDMQTRATPAAKPPQQAVAQPTQSTTSEPTAPEPIASEPSQAAPEPTSASPSAPSGFEFKPIPGALIEEFSEYLDDTRLQRITAEIEDMTSASVEHMASLSKLLQPLKAGAHFIRAELTEQLLQVWRSTLDQLSQSEDNAFDADAVQYNCQEAFAVLKDLHTSLTNHHGEANFWQEQASRERFDSVIHSLTALAPAPNKAAA